MVFSKFTFSFKGRQTTLWNSRSVKVLEKHDRRVISRVYFSFQIYQRIKIYHLIQFFSNWVFLNQKSVNHKLFLNFNQLYGHMFFLSNPRVFKKPFFKKPLSYFSFSLRA